MRRYILRVTLCIATVVTLAAGWIPYTHRAARLDLSNSDDSYTAEKSIGLVPASKEIYAEGVGFVDQTIFYQAVVTPDEVPWLAQAPEVSHFEAPNQAPLWWSLSLWWHGRNSDMKYFGTSTKSPCLFAYSKQKGLVYGTVEFDRTKPQNPH
ncbi:MAG: hypothetical protein H7A55_18380 [Verrucomicrobiaceae bacterium]|nr:hypothetical protein [Verrucomicrobiaceae bacterium]